MKNPKTAHSVLVIIRGLPGSGKSYIADMLYQKIGSNAAIMLDPDATNYDSDEYKEHVKQQLSEGVEPILHPYRFLRSKAYKAIESHKILLWNQPFTNLEMLKKVTTRLEEHATENNTKLSILIIEVSIDPDIARKRVKDRIATGGHGPSDTKFDKFIDEYSTSAALGYPIISLEGSADNTDKLPKLVETILELSTN